MDSETSQLILKELMNLSGSTSRVESKVDYISKRMDRNERRCTSNFDAIFRKLDDHDDRITVLETKMGKHGWKSLNGNSKLKVKLGISLGGLASLILALLYAKSTIGV